MAVNSALTNGTNNPEQGRNTANALASEFTCIYQSLIKGTPPPDGVTNYAKSVQGVCPTGYVPLSQAGSISDIPVVGPTLNAVNNASLPLPNVPNPISGTTDFLNRLWQGLTNRNFWKGIGLLFLGVAAVGIGALIMFRGPSGGSQAIVRVIRSRGKEAEKETEE